MGSGKRIVPEKLGEKLKAFGGFILYFYQITVQLRKSYFQNSY
jgi:hypothetical protein